MTGNEVFTTMAIAALAEGEVVEPEGNRTRELLAATYSLDMRFPLLSFPARKLNYRFAAAEALWILDGSNRIDHSPQIQKIWAKYSDDGVTTEGAYGPHVVAQLPYIVNELNRGCASRRAVLTIWRPSPQPGLKDYACTVAMQFLVRRGYLDTIVTMRSQDLYLGFPYDVFNFTMISTFVASQLEVKPGLGKLFMQVGSLHIYEKDVNVIKGVLATDPIYYPALNRMSVTQLTEFLRVMRDVPEDLEYYRHAWMIDHVVAPRDETQA